jgi:hypothetical protein
LNFSRLRLTSPFLLFYDVAEAGQRAPRKATTRRLRGTNGCTTKASPMKRLGMLRRGSGRRDGRSVKPSRTSERI